MTIVTSIVHDIHAVIDSDENTLDAVNTAVEALSTYDICEAGTDGHDDCEDDDPCCDMDDWPSLRDVGDVVAEWLRDHIDEHVTHDILKIMFLDLLDLGNVAVLEEIGRTWYPGDAYRRLSLAGKL